MAGSHAPLPAARRRSAQLLQLVEAAFASAECGNLRTNSSKISREFTLSPGPERHVPAQKRGRYFVALGIFLDHLLVFEMDFHRISRGRRSRRPRTERCRRWWNSDSAGSLPRIPGGPGRCCPDRRPVWHGCKAPPRTCLGAASGLIFDSGLEAITAGRASVFLNAGQALGNAGCWHPPSGSACPPGVFLPVRQSLVSGAANAPSLPAGRSAPGPLPAARQSGLRVADIWRRDCSLASRALAISSRRRRSSASRSSIHSTGSQSSSRPTRGASIEECYEQQAEWQSISSTLTSHSFYAYHVSRNCTRGG